jgi:hypothetical protein
MYPPLPYRHQVDSSSIKLYFPVGEWDGIFTNIELRHAMQYGVEVLEVHEAVYYDHSDYVYRDYVEELYGLRLRANDEVDKYKYKIFLNSLYGKAGQIGEVQTICPSTEKYHVDKREEGWEAYGDWIMHTEEGKPALFTNFIWAAYITSGSRCLLHRHLVELEGLYCDTDSVFTIKPIGESDKLGDLSLEETTNTLQVLGPKVYKTDTKVKVKGVPKKALAVARTFTEDGEEYRYVPLAEVEELGRSFLFDRPIRFREGTSRGIKPNTWTFEDKNLKLLPIDMKRHFFKNGTSRPFTVEEICALRPPWAGASALPYYKFQSHPKIRVGAG